MNRNVSFIQDRFVIISPFAPSLLIFRGPLIRDLICTGWEVITLAPDFTPDVRKKVQNLGALTVDYFLDRTGINPVKDLITIFELVRILRRIQPEVVLTYHAKLNTYGILAAWLAQVPVRLAIIEGLGFAFTSGQENFKKFLIQKILRTLYRISFKKADKIFFLNQDDLREFYPLKIARPDQSVLLGGIGLDLDYWSPVPPHLEPITFTLIARLLREKGVLEFFEAARQIKRLYPNVRFLLIGRLDTNPGAISKREVQCWVQEKIVKWISWTDDVPFYLKQTSVHVLPSYREGVPRSTQEAMAMARPVITTDVPGCRETVIDGLNGFLIPPHDVGALVSAMECFIREPELIGRMGRESRRLAEERFDVRKVNARFITLISDVLSKL